MTTTDKSFANVLRAIEFDSLEQIHSLGQAAAAGSAEERVLQMLWMAVGQVEDDLRREKRELDQLSARVTQEQTHLSTGMRTTADWIMQSAVKVSEIDAAIRKNIDKAIELAAVYRLL